MATGVCECGCGQRTTVPTSSNARRGIVKGEPRRFVHGPRRAPAAPREWSPPVGEWRDLKSLAKWGWAAGLYEGEGCMYARPGGSGSSYLQMTVSSNDRDVLERFREVVSVGRIRGPVLRSQCQPHYVWRAGARDDVLHVVGMLWAFLSPRRQEQALRAFQRAQNVRVADGT